MVDINKSYEDMMQEDTTTTFRIPKPLQISDRPTMDASSALARLQDEDFIENLRDYYTYRDGATGVNARGITKFAEADSADILEYFYNDRTWRNYNTASMTTELIGINMMDNERVRQFAEINEVYKNLPNFWDDPNRSFGSWLYDFGGALLVDPVNVVGFGAGKAAATVAYREALKKALRGKMANEVTEQTLKKAQLEANKAGFKSAIKRGALYEGLASGGITGVQDALLQHTALTSNVQDEFSFKRLGMATAFGTGLGTVFGGAFGYGSFRFNLAKQRKNSFKNLKDIHDYGFDTNTGDQLFVDLTKPAKGKNLYQNKTAEQVANIKRYTEIRARGFDEQLEELDKIIMARTPDELGKPPKELINFGRLVDDEDDLGIAKALKKLVKDNESTITRAVNNKNFGDIRNDAELVGQDPEELIKSITEFGDSKIAGQLLAIRQMMKYMTDSMVKYGQLLDDPTLTLGQQQAIVAKAEARRIRILQLLPRYKQASATLATALASQRQSVESIKAINLIANPENPVKLRELNGDVVTYYKQLGKLDDDTKVILAMQNTQTVNKWDLAAEYVNSVLLSSPDTHLLNLLSVFVKMQVVPATMMLRAMNMRRHDKARAKEIMWEGIETYIYQYIYTYDAVKASLKSLYLNRPVLDSAQMKYDSNIKQGQLASWASQFGAKLFGDTTVGRRLNYAFVKTPVNAITFSLRALAAGDELMKTSVFKARAAAMINSRIMREHPEVFERADNFTTIAGAKDIKKYRELAQKYMAEFMTPEGRANTTIQGLDNSIATKSLSPADKLEVNDPLATARRMTFTSPAQFQAQRADGTYEGEVESGLTGIFLSLGHKYPFIRPLGLHFVNTPGQLFRTMFQYSPPLFAWGQKYGLGRYQMQMRQMLKKDESGNYINPEAAAEALAREQMGYLIWASAFLSVFVGGKMTGGGSRDFKVNEERKKNTNWQPYAIKQDDGTYIGVNRLDPFIMPYAVMADIRDGLEDVFKNNEDLPPDAINKYMEFSMAMVASLTRNLTSKFYTKNILETADAFLGDGFASAKDPERLWSNILGRTVYKIVPFSGTLRYADRVMAEEQQEYWNLWDKFRALDPFNLVSNPDAVSKKRNMLGEEIDNDRGYLFGLGGFDGVASSPFKMSMNYTEDDILTEFFKDRDVTYTSPPKKDPYFNTRLNLRNIYNEKGQTAYDRWLEIKSQIKQRHPQTGKMVTLREYLTYEIRNPKSLYQRIPVGKSSPLVYGVDEQQNYITSIIRNYEKAAFVGTYQDGKAIGIIQEFPIIEEQVNKRNLIKQEAQDRANKNYLEGLIK